jgi:hypothetical protein
LIVNPLILLLIIGTEVIFQLGPNSQGLNTPEQPVITNRTDSQKPGQDIKLEKTIVVPSVEPTYTPTKSIIAEQHNENVSVSLDWAVAYEHQIIMQFTVNGYELRDGVQFADVIEEMFKIIDENGKSIYFYSGYSANINALDEDSFVVYFEFNGDYRPDPTGNLNLLAEIQIGGFDVSYISPTITFVPGPIPTETVHIPNVGNFEIPFSVTIQKGTEIEVNQSVVVNNIELRLERVSINPTGIDALICFQMPSSADWQLTATTITTGDGQVFHVRRSRVVGNKSSISNSDSQRCNLVSFVTPYDMRTENFSISVPKLVTSVTMTEESIQAANRKLSDLGISFDVVQADHSYNFEIHQKPEGMSDEELYTLIWNSLRADYPGPWKISIGE